MGMVGNNSRMDSPRVSRDLVLQNFKHISFLLIFSIFDALDACLMVHSSWLKAHGQGSPGEAHGSALGTQRRANLPWPPLAMSHGP